MYGTGWYFQSHCGDWQYLVVKAVSQHYGMAAIPAGQPGAEANIDVCVMRLIRLDAGYFEFFIARQDIACDEFQTFPDVFSPNHPSGSKLLEDKLFGSPRQVCPLKCFG